MYRLLAGHEAASIEPGAPSQDSVVVDWMGREPDVLGRVLVWAVAVTRLCGKEHVVVCVGKVRISGPQTLKLSAR
jgi:hypothetical protein